MPRIQRDSVACGRDEPGHQESIRVAIMSAVPLVAASQRAADAEQALLGGLMLDPGAWVRLGGEVTVADFARADHRLIFTAVAALVEGNQPPDAVTVSEHLRRLGQLEAIGGTAYLARLVQGTPSATNIRAYGRIVNEAATRRRLVELGQDLAARANDSAVPAESIAADSLAKLSRLSKADDSPELRVCGIGDFLSLELPPRVDLLAPWLPRQGLAMIHARRGAGKTFLALHVAWAVACGSEFLRWRAPAPAGVLYVDGEMPAVALQERLARMALAAASQPRAPLDFATPDLQKGGMPDLASFEGQSAIDACVRDDHALIVVDNLSSLCRAGKENEAESWLTVQTWALRHRAAGRSILFVHHSGKSGLQRGTSRREDVLDTVIQLRQPPSYEISDGARFEVAFEKARGIVGADVEPFEAALSDDASGKPCWSMKSAGRTEQVIAMAEDGMKPAEIAAELGVARSTVYRKIKAAVDEGKLPVNVVKARD